MLLSARTHEDAAAERAGAVAEGTGAWTRFREWRRQRPFWGGALVSAAGVELFFSGQLDLGKIHLQFGIEGMQGTILPAALVLLGILSMLSPAQRTFYGIVSLIVAVYSLIGVNLGGFFVGFVLGVIGGILIVAWMPRPEPVESAEPVEAAAPVESAGPVEPDRAGTAAALEPAPAGGIHAEFVPGDRIAPSGPHRART